MSLNLNKSLEEIIKRKKGKSSKEIQDESKNVKLFCNDPTQKNFDKLQKSTKEDFIKFANLIIKLEKGNVKLAKIIVKLKV